MKDIIMNKWIVSDTHFNHKNIIKFTGNDGSLIRPGFTSKKTNTFVSFTDIDQHNEMLVDNWNSDIGQFDKVYFLGDFGDISFAKRLNGKKRLILGNHDNMTDKYDLVKYFDQIMVSRIFTTEFVRPIMMTHYPVHKDERGRAPRYVNVHGHTHEKDMLDENGRPDPWYINVCVEKTNCYPMHWDTLNDILRKNKV